MFAGDLSNSAAKAALIAAGWVPCDGASYTQAQYPELYAAIGSAHGGAGTSFNVPKLTDRLPRGTNYSSNDDPDGGSRTAAESGGATGHAVGSLQQSATALPKNQWVLSQDGDHYHAYQHLTSARHEAWSGSTDRMARSATTVTIDAAGEHFHSMSGGDPVTLPINVALYWIIRATSGTPAAQTPAGALGAFGASAAAQSPAGWLYCNGQAVAIGSNSTNLANAIGSNFGGDGVTVLTLPNLRGQFLRGTSHNTGRDPNAASRYALMTGGNTGDGVGSAQGFATGSGQNPLVVATAGEHTHARTLVPANDHHAAWGASGPAAYYCMKWTDDWTNTTSAGTHTHSVTGGDKETRPVNIYLDWIIADDVIPDAPPIGTILAFGGDVTSIDIFSNLLAAGWLPCIGQRLKKSDPNYKALYNLIDGIYGQDNLTFALPDLRGYFVVGAGGSKTIGTVTAQSLTGQPETPFATTPVGDHTHQVTGIPTDTHVIDVVMGVDLAENNNNPTSSTVAGSHSHVVVTGGDAESRPMNINVDYIIRYR
ncbi:phage tail protein [Burkholderia sp. S-53]|uniref:phage tail protein n=1 Tax=Burkholderia sp. S-53 TaxID=2906514 RepID=UPI0021D2087E|nr:phage tail protein [Burkholderia sp. S-53]UXU91262.1 phage tail protein [Burkholderia sp. S-53]